MQIAKNFQNKKKHFMRTKLSELKRGDKFSFLPKSKIATYTFIKPVGKKFHYVTTTNLKDRYKENTRAKYSVDKYRNGLCKGSGKTTRNIFVR